MKSNHNSIDMISLLAGLAMAVAGMYWLLSSVRVTTGFYGLHIGSFSVSSGLTVVPFVVGVVMLFFNFRSIPARLVAAGGLLIIVASVIMSTRFVFLPTSLFSLLVMLALIAGGGVLIVKAVWGGGKKSS